MYKAIRAIAYVRDSVFNPDVLCKQVRELARYCEQMSIAPDTVLCVGGSGFLSFDGKSGKTVKKAILREGADVLLVKRSSLCFRDTDVLDAIAWLKRHKVRIYFIDEKDDRRNQHAKRFAEPSPN